MTRVHALILPDCEWLSDEDIDPAPPRPALAGGSDRRPPDDRDPGGRIIRFPRERARRPEPAPADLPDPGAPKPAKSDDGSAATGGETLWPAWMAHVLTRYRAPEGGGGGHPSGVYI